MSETSVLALVASGRNGGGWNGGGIMTGQANAAAGRTGLAVASADEIQKVGQVWAGFTLNSGDVLVKYTYDGDADLSGNITGDDYFQIDSGYARQRASPLTGYFNGDFNYDGRFDADDYFIIDHNYGHQSLGTFTNASLPPGALVSGVAAVPEPGAFRHGRLAIAGLLRRRRRAN